MKLSKILYNVIEMFLFVTASIYVTNNYIIGQDNLTKFFGCFLLLIFIKYVIKEAESDAVHAISETGGKE